MGSIDVGNRTARPPGRPVIPHLARTDETHEPRIEAPNTVRNRRPGNCGAMTQQCGDSGNYSTPQKFVQLVGYRDPKASSGPRLRPGPAKP